MTDPLAAVAVAKASDLKPEALGRVVVVYGGNSAEREVSLRSGAAVLAGLLRAGVDAVGLDFRGNVQALISEQPDLVFIALHGRGGEDGTLQGLLDVLGMAYTGSGVLGSALCMDKLRSKRLWQGYGLPTPDFISSVEMAGEDLTADDVVTRLGLPLFVKPSHEGSSVGMSRVNSAGELASALVEAEKYDSEVLIERFVQGSEYTAAVVGDVVLPLIRIETPREFYDYAAKYQSGDTLYHCPSGLAIDEERQLKQLCKQAFDTAGASGWGRVDIMVDENIGPQLIEVNTVPGMTDTSLVPMAADAKSLSFEGLVLRIAQLAVFNAQTNNDKKTNKNSKPSNTPTTGAPSVAAHGGPA